MSNGPWFHGPAVPPPDSGVTLPAGNKPNLPSPTWAQRACGCVTGQYGQAWPAANWTAINSTSFCSPRIGRTMTVKLTSFP